ncbi:MAG TPA: hypothetical protein VIV58_05355 [Kofleriaceae bacterium]
MAEERLHKEIVDTGPSPELVALKRKINVLQALYAVLFVASLVLIVTNFGKRNSDMTILWAVSLGGAVLVRLYRQSQVSKYNAIVMGGRVGPMV